MRKTEMANPRKILVRDLNKALTCTLCGGYLVDATTLTECNHVFCRGCILRYLESNKATCPTCNTACKKKNQVFFRTDLQLQSIVYKVVPGLFSREMQRREDFYRSTGVRASSSCSDDSVLERERDMINDEDALVSSHVGDKNQFFGPEDSISLSLEYYQRHLDTTPVDSDATDKSARNGEVDKKDGKDEGKSAGDKRFLQCPAAVSMRHLQKFVRMKYALSANHKVDIIYEGEVLPPHFSLMDVAYTFKWERLKPLRFFYRIFIPSKIQPIKIVNTALSTGEKQLQIVPSTKVEPQKPPKVEEPPPEIKRDEKKETKESEEEKVRLLAHLQLQSKTKVQSQPEKIPETVAEQPQVQDCVFDYEEQDKEEIKRFAEIRDREWAMQKKMDETREKEKEEDYHHFSKKRKKSKHSKNDFVYKKRKLHAEITNKEEELKLKVKLTQHNGHKHKHHKSSSQNQEDDMSAKKEKLFQMRQIRHKHVSSEDKNIQTVPSGSISKDIISEIASKKEERKNREKVFEFKDKAVETTAPAEETIPTNGINATEETAKQMVDMVTSKTLRSDFPSKTTGNQEWGGAKVATVQIERNEQTEQQAKKTFYKSYQAYAEKYQKAMEKSQQNIKHENAKPVSRPPILPLKCATVQLERKIANLQQRCTIEAKNIPVKPENRMQEKKFCTPDKIKSLSTPPLYPAGFTVSKIESGVKRKTDAEENGQDKRPSLEITLINPPTNEIKPPTQAKRPPPPTIPLDRIKKSFKPGISIIPKMPSEKCDNIGALDLSARPPNKEGESSGKPVNGFNSPTLTKDGKNPNISNLQMLSKVATEHPSLNKTPKPRPQLPNLQTLKIPSPAQRIPNLDKLPKLTEINKSQFRLMSPQIRNLRPNQNQNIRNIPNPSLLVRQQNQNRLNSMNPVRENNNKEKEVAKITTPPAEIPKANVDVKLESKEVTV